ncbi:hypothetical protein [Burkholderia alba]|uniref:hypothetical protein n=1 Tax=Burkholderia alba TaxID=2683677 RepID=UPI002B05522B|nr:hypothetical protein [Burkholderia alba]
MGAPQKTKGRYLRRLPRAAAQAAGKISDAASIGRHLSATSRDVRRAGPGVRGTAAERAFCIPAAACYKRWTGFASSPDEEINMGDMQ